MDDAEGVPLLLANASQRVTTASGVLRRWSNDGVREAIRRHERQIGRVPPARSAQLERDRSIPDEIVERWWVNWPTQMRLETETEHLPALRIVDGAEWWSVDASGRIRGSVGYGGAHLYRGGLADMLDPSGLLGAVTLVSASETTFASHPALAVTVVPRVTMRQLAYPRPEVMARFVDRYQLVLHADLGVLLRAESILDGEVVQVAELIDAVFSQPLDIDLFRYDPPAGVTVEPAPDATGRLADGTEVARA